MRKFNFIYDKIVVDEKDVNGFVAYSLYKKNKIEYIESTKKDKDLDSLSDFDLQEFCRMSNTDSQIERYRNEAKTILKEYTAILFQQRLDQIDAHYQKHSVKNFWSGALQSAVGSLIFTFGMGLFFFLLWSYNVGIEDIVENIFNVEITEKK